MKPVEIRNMTEAEIEHAIFSLKEKLFSLRSEKVSGRLERPQRVRGIKRDIARCFTVLKEKKSGK